MTAQECFYFAGPALAFDPQSFWEQEKCCPDFANSKPIHASFNKNNGIKHWPFSGSTSGQPSWWKILQRSHSWADFDVKRAALIHGKSERPQLSNNSVQLNVARTTLYPSLQLRCKQWISCSTRSTAGKNEKCKSVTVVIFADLFVSLN